MSQDFHDAELWAPPRQRVPVLWVSEQNVSDFWSLFVNRKAYTRQSDRPSPETQRHYYYRAHNKILKENVLIKERRELDRAAVRRHLARN